jgi:histidine ammonia-lyase
LGEAWPVEVAPVALDGERLTCEDLAAVAAGAPAMLDEAARARMATSARWVASRDDKDVLRRKWAWLAGSPPPDGDPALIAEFIRGHCAGVGDPLPTEQVRATLAARINVFASGCSGVRPELADHLLGILARGPIPVVPSQGTVGAAGSAVLAHIAHAACAGFALTEKEALSLLNGSTHDTALAALAVVRSERLLTAAEAACGLSFEVMEADEGCLSPLAHEARRHPGPIATAERLRARCAGSELVIRRSRPDSFSIRCAPAVLGAAREALAHTRAVVERELNAAGDNPLAFPTVDWVEAGNFHGAPVALAMDHLKIALAQVAGISERRTFRLTYGQLSGLPSFLVPGDGLLNGLMLAQYTAASLVSECKGLSHPASVDSIPTVQHHEDHVSMGTIAARTALHLVELVADVLAIELLCAAQGLDFRISGEHGPARAPGAGNLRTWEAVRALVPRWREDRVLHPDLRAVGAAVRAGSFT